ncbi:MAG: ferritin-like protein [Undibacterium sp.]|nr:ferritin-like protein [Undibacterium sp.]
MSNTSMNLKGVIPALFSAKKNRSLSELPKDKAAVTALMQAAINVENFTIPLYLASLASIQGTHGISSVPGRLWPGLSPAAKLDQPLTPTQQAYNAVFSVFIQEMLHLQLAANLATVVGVIPKFFKATVLENVSGGWNCFGPTLTTIPHIIDLQDTKTYAEVKVNLAALDSQQLDLFLAIEQSHDAARKDIKDSALHKYFPSTPFENWNENSSEVDLPLFGTIGWMYQCLLQYLGMEYEGGKTLWAYMFNADNLDMQRDLFNRKGAYHTRQEYPLMPMEVSASDPDLALIQAVDMIHGIVNQGEGGIENMLKGFRLFAQQRISRQVSMNETVSLRDEVSDNHVERRYQPDFCALEVDYNLDKAYARSKGDEIDHWERFDLLKKVVGEPGYMNFSQWFAAGNSWTANDLQTSAYQPSTTEPSPQEVANALNSMNTPAYRQLLDQLIVGAIDGINNTLSLSWTDATKPFPMQAMKASGDRMTLYWAVFGAAPDISKGNPAPTPGSDDAHACQGLSVENPGNNCAPVSAYHTCQTSNSCKGQSGCGYPLADGTTASSNFVAPTDNTCAQKGGCAAPISDWQSYSSSGTMDLIDIDNGQALNPSTMQFQQGESVYDVAWAAYTAIMASKGKTAGAQPAPNPLRIVMPPN